MTAESPYRWRPRPAMYRLAKIVLGPIVKNYFRVSWTGAEHIPAQGPVVLVCNHQSNLDPLMLGLASSRRVNFMAKVELFRVPLLRQIISAWGAVPLRRGTSDPEALRLADQILQSGEMLGLFPEGTRSRDGNLQPFRFGAARLAIKHEAQLVPMALWGTIRAMPRGARFPRPRKVRMAFAPPLRLEDYQVAGEASEVSRNRMAEALTADLHAAVGRLLESIRS